MFTTLKAQITTLATALYGTSSSLNTAFGLLTYITSDASDTSSPNCGVALILYTGCATSPFTSWEVLAHVEGQETFNDGAERLLEDLRRAVGGVIRDVVRRDWRVEHRQVPDVVEGNMAEEDGGEEDDENENEKGWRPTLIRIEEEDCSHGDGIEEDDRPGK